MTSDRKQSMEEVPLTDFQVCILHEFPYPVAINYQRLLNAKSSEDKARKCLQVFEFMMRFLSLTVISQYLLKDRETISDNRLNALLKQNFAKPTIWTLVEIVFSGLAAYRDRHDLMFMPELYNAYWDTQAQRPRKGIRKPFDKLVELRNRLAHGLPPDNDTGWQVLFEESHELLLQVFEFIRFIRNYDLILITGKGKTKDRYQIYKGIDIIETTGSLQPQGILIEGRFYLSTANMMRLLQLYPFFLTTESVDSISPPHPDIAFLDRFSSSRIHYIALVSWVEVIRQDENLLADFFYSYEQSLTKKIRNQQSPTVSRETTQESIRPKIGRFLNIFLCHSTDDKPAVRNLYRRLHKDGFSPWLDEEALLPGQDWDHEIHEAVRNTDVVIVCLSRLSVTKAGYVQKELKFALDVADMQPENTIFIIPVKLEDCDVPERLSKWQWVSLNQEHGYELLIKALQSRAKGLGIRINDYE